MSRGGFIADMIAINTSGHAFVMTTRMMAPAVLGFKICRGIALTGQEADRMSAE